MAIWQNSRAAKEPALVILRLLNALMCKDVLLYGVGTILFLAAGGYIIDNVYHYDHIVALGGLLIITGLLFAIDVVINILNHRSK